MEMRFISARFAQDAAAAASAIPKFSEAVQFYRAFANFANGRNTPMLSRYPQTGVQC